MQSCLTNDITVTAAVGGTWIPATAVATISPSEFNGVDAQPAATLSTCYNPRTPDVAGRFHNLTMRASKALTVTKTVTATISSALPIQKSTDLTDGHISRLTGLQNATYHMSEIASGLQSIISAHINGSIANSDDNIVHAGENADPPSIASTTNASIPILPLTGMAVLGYPGGTIVFLNNTSPSYILVDHANASIIIWNSPVNASDTASNTHIGKLVSKIGVWLPYFEALGILALVYKIGKFIYDGVQRLRGRGDQAQGSPRGVVRPTGGV